MPVAIQQPRGLQNQWYLEICWKKHAFEGERWQGRQEYIEEELYWEHAPWYLPKTRVLAREEWLREQG